MHLQKWLIITLLQKYYAHKSLQFYRRRSNRFGENGLTDACRAVFQKQAAPKSHSVLFCHEPLQPGTRCGELRGGLSSRPPGAESLKHRKLPRRSRPDGSIGLCGGSYCRRSSSVRGWAARQPGIHHNGKPGLQIRANMTVDCKSAAAQSSHNDAQSMLKFSSPSGMA